MLTAQTLRNHRGLAAALHSGDPAYGALPGYFRERLEPALESLLAAATASGEIRGDISPRYLLHAVANLCLPMAGEGVAYSQRMVGLLIDGLRYGGAPVMAPRALSQAAGPEGHVADAGGSVSEAMHAVSRRRI